MENMGKYILCCIVSFMIICPNIFAGDPPAKKDKKLSIQLEEELMLNSLLSSPELIDNSMQVISSTNANNSVTVKQKGIDNKTVILQIGEENLIQSTVEGNFSYANYAQFGGNNYIQDAVKGNGVSHSVVQVGNQNELKNQGLTKKSFTVKQTGGAKLYIK